ncbi:hypothetical protein ACYPKM_02120 [Pseudomonas aeruginosa]
MSFPQITQIKTSACPDCGCSVVVAAEVERKHTNGYWNEFVRFECGYKLHFSPNFMRVDAVAECPKSNRAVAWKELKGKLSQAAVENIEATAKVTLDEKNRRYLLADVARIFDAHQDVLQGNPAK